MLASPIDISAEHIEYLWKTKQFQASGNIVIQYKGHMIEASEVNFDLEEGQLSFPNHVRFEQGTAYFQSKSFNYNMNTYEGDAIGVQSKLDRVYIEGDSLQLNTDRIELRNATFTTCDHPDHHYILEAEHIWVYPQFGFVVAWNNWLSLGTVPLLPLPCYIYGSARYSLLGQSTPLPDIGSNEREGFFVKESLSYFIDKDSSGRVLFGASQQLGGLVGVTHGFRLEDNLLTLKGFYATNQGFSGGIQYDHMGYDEGVLPSQIVTENESLLIFSDKVLPTEVAPLYRLSLQHLYRQLENDYWVDRRPYIQIQVFQGALYGGVDYSWKANFGQLGEFQSIDEYFSSWRSNVDVFLYKYIDFGDFIQLKTRLSSLGYWYDTGTTWQRLFVDVGLAYTEEHFQTELSYSKQLFTTGASLFGFESVNMIESDELGFDISVNLWGHRLGLELDYTVVQPEIPLLSMDRFRNFDVLHSMDFHCWRFLTRWKVQQANFQFGVELY